MEVLKLLYRILHYFFKENEDYIDYDVHIPIKYIKRQKNGSLEFKVSDSKLAVEEVLLRESNLSKNGLFALGIVQKHRAPLAKTIFIKDDMIVYNENETEKNLVDAKLYLIEINNEISYRRANLAVNSFSSDYPDKYPDILISNCKVHGRIRFAFEIDKRLPPLKKREMKKNIKPSPKTRLVLG